MNRRLSGVAVFAIALALTQIIYAALPSHYGPYTVNGNTYYIVNGSNPSLNTGTAVCAAAGLKCIGYTDFSTNLCSMIHPNATVVSSVNGSSTGYYCNGPPQIGECSFRHNTCDICANCNVNANCNFTISGLFREMYVQCSSNSTIIMPSAVVRRSGFTNFASFWAKIFGRKPPLKNFFGYAAPPKPTSSLLCPIGCWLYEAGGAPGAGPSAVNCNVNQTYVHKPASTCYGTQSNVGQGNNVSCSCRPDPVIAMACPYSCESSGITCTVVPQVVGKSYVPCDGSITQTNQNCKCVFEQGNWTFGSRFGIN